MIKRVEFDNLIQEYQNHPKVLELKNCKHHGIDRYDHSFRVAYHTYRVTKLLGLNYQSATKAAMLHDLFTDEVEEEGLLGRLRQHPSVAVENARTYFGLTDLEEDIIKTHMFPVTFTPPKYLEGWIVDAIDDVASIYERIYSLRFQLQAATNVILMLILSFKK